MPMRENHHLHLFCSWSTNSLPREWFPIFVTPVWYQFWINAKGYQNKSVGIVKCAKRYFQCTKIISNSTVTKRRTINKCEPTGSNKKRSKVDTVQTEGGHCATCWSHTFGRLLNLTMNSDQQMSCHVSTAVWPAHFGNSATSSCQFLGKLHNQFGALKHWPQICYCNELSKSKLLLLINKKNYFPTMVVF